MLVLVPVHSYVKPCSGQFNCLPQAARIAGGCLGLAKSGSLRRANRLSRLEVPRAIQDMKKSTSTSTPVEDLDAGDEDSVTDTTSSSTPTTTAVPAEAGVFTGGVEIPFTSQLRLIDPAHFPVSFHALLNLLSS